jgi:hypothetical protein
MAFTLPLFLATVLGGCLGFRGFLVPEAYRITIPSSGEELGTWQTKDLSLSYRYSMQQGKLKISGEAFLYKYNIDYFFMHAYFLDAEGRVIDSAPILSSGWGGRLTFTTEKSIPAGAATFALGYTGQVTIREFGSIPFWDYPF